MMYLAQINLINITQCFLLSIKIGERFPNQKEKLFGKCVLNAMNKSISANNPYVNYVFKGGHPIYYIQYI